MNRLLAAFLGPELYWIVLYLVCRWLASQNVPPTAAGNAMLNWTVWLVATVGVLVSFALLLNPAASRWIMLLRLALAGFIGLNACIIAACEAIKYPELGRDSGLMALWMLAVGAGSIIWVVAAMASVLVIRATPRVAPSLEFRL